MASRAQRNIKSISYAKYGYMFILPFFLIYATFQLYPIIYTFILGFRDKMGEEFIGVDNFSAILFGTGENAFFAKSVHEKFLTSIQNTFIIWTANFIPQLILSLLLAVWFTDSILNIKGKTFFKTVMYMPNILTAASIAALFLKLFGNTDSSAFNAFMLDIGLIDEALQFLSNKGLRFGMIAYIQTWMWYGNTMILLISGIMGINPSLYEAANIDGANSRQVFFKITVPLLRPILLFTIITSMIGGLQMFDIPLLYNQAGLQEVAAEYKTVAIFIYDTYIIKQTRQFGIAGASSMVLFAITAILGIIIFYINRDKDEIAANKRKKKLRKQLAQKNKNIGGLGI